jgi:hypothetical protein
MQDNQHPQLQTDPSESASLPLTETMPKPEAEAFTPPVETTPAEEADISQAPSAPEQAAAQLKVQPSEGFGEVPVEAGLSEAEAAEITTDSASLEKALKDTKAWATRLSQDNSLLRQALDAALMIDPPTMMSDPEVGKRLEIARGCLEKHSELGPVIELLDTVIRGVASYEQEVGRQALTFAVLSEHPDALELKGNPDFTDWAQNQPPLVKQCLCQSTHPEDISWALSLFKEQRSSKNTTDASRVEHALRMERMRHSASPSPQTSSAPSTGGWTREQIERMSLEEYRKNEADIDAALARGEIS